MRASQALLAVALACAAVAAQAAPGDRALFLAGSVPLGVAMPAKPLVAAGEARVDDALSRLIPAPYGIVLDERVPTSMYLVWPASNNWMESLRLALAPVGLQVRADWAHNELFIFWSSAAALAQAGAAAAPAPAALATKPSAADASKPPLYVSIVGAGKPLPRQTADPAAALVVPPGVQASGSFAVASVAEQDNPPAAATTTASTAAPVGLAPAAKPASAPAATPAAVPKAGARTASAAPPAAGMSGKFVVTDPDANAPAAAPAATPATGNPMPMHQLSDLGGIL